MTPERKAALEYLRSYHGSIDSEALLLAFEAGIKAEEPRP